VVGSPRTCHSKNSVFPDSWGLWDDEREVGVVDHIARCRRSRRKDRKFRGIWKDGEKKRQNRIWVGPGTKILWGQAMNTSKRGGKGRGVGVITRKGSGGYLGNLLERKEHTRGVMKAGG